MKTPALDRSDARVSSSSGHGPASGTDAASRRAGREARENERRGAVSVRQTHPMADSRWADFVASHPDALIYHHPRWFAVLEKAYGYKPAALACEDVAGSLVGVLPLVEKRGLISGRHLSSLPHTPVAGPLAADSDAKAALVRAAVERLDAGGRGWLQLKVLAPDLDGLVHGVVGSPWEATYILRLPDDPAQLRFGNSRNHARIKWAVNKARRLGVRIRAAESDDDLGAWYGLYVDTMRQHVVPPRPYRFFRAMWEAMQDAGYMRLLLAEQRQGTQNVLLAGSLFLMYGRTVFFAFNGRRGDALALRPNDAIQWQSIHDACREGYRWYDLGEVDEHNRGLAEFKTKWGAEARRMYRYHYPESRELEAGVLKPGSRAQRMARAAWRLLPPKATASVGDWVYKRL